MSLKNKTATLQITLLLVSLLLSFIPQAALQGENQNGIERELVNKVVAGTPHGPIAITGNDVFKTTAESESWDGDGSEGDPYIIEDFDFDLGGTNGKCIDIQDTTVHFIIRDCTFTGASLMGGMGIRMYNVTNCEVSGNIMYDNYYATYLNADNATIVNNEVLSTVSVGFYLFGAENSIISENTIHGGQNGLVLDGLKHSEINNNTITDSAQLSMYLSSCEYLTFADNDLIRGSMSGFYLEFTDNCTFIRNTCSECGNGFFLSFADDNSISSCNLERNTNGLFVDPMGSYENVIELCEFRDNVEWGIILQTGSRNLFKWNIFVNNSYGSVLCDGSDNIFDYNYYDYYSGPDINGDKIGDFPLSHPGSAREEDPHPLLLFPTYPEWESSPKNQNIEFGDEFSYNLQITPPIPIGEWDISDTARFTIDDTGTIRDIDILDVGTYPLGVVATNTYGLSLEGSFTVTVGDSVSPVWISQIQDKTFGPDEDVEIQLMAWDLAGIDSWDINEPGNFSLSYSSLGEIGILTIVGIGNLAAGSYSLVITAYDPSGNYVTATLTVTVTTSGGGAAIDTEFIMSTAGLAVGFVALCLGVVAFLNTRKKP